MDLDLLFILPELAINDLFSTESVSWKSKIEFGGGLLSIRREKGLFPAGSYAPQPGWGLVEIT